MYPIGLQGEKVCSLQSLSQIAKYHRFDVLWDGQNVSHNASIFSFYQSHNASIFSFINPTMHQICDILLLAINLNEQALW